MLLGRLPYPETNMTSYLKNSYLEDYFSFRMPIFSGAMLVSRRSIFLGWMHVVILLQVGDFFKVIFALGVGATCKNWQFGGLTVDMEKKGTQSIQVKDYNFFRLLPSS